MRQMGGLFGEGIRRLDQAIAGPIPAARKAAEFCKGLTLREMGNEQDARVIFERIYSEEPGFEANAAALADPKYRLVITSKEMIDARTDRWDPDSAPPSAADLVGDDLSERGGNEYLRAAQEELDRQIGLSEVKLQVAKLKSAAMLAKVRGDKGGLNAAARSLHLAFTGPPGTGKTTIARVVAQTYCGLGLLRTPNIVEAKRSDFVGQHLGSTAIKTTALIDSAMDGVLFIDEAYTLIQTGLAGGDAFGREAVDTLLARMENDRDRLVVIIAGYDARSTDSSPRTRVWRHGSPNASGSSRTTPPNSVTSVGSSRDPVTRSCRTPRTRNWSRPASGCARARRWTRAVNCADASTCSVTAGSSATSSKRPRRNASTG